MAQLPEILEWYTLTPMVNEIKTPQTWLRDTFFTNVRTLTTEQIVFSVLTGGREIAPFVSRNGQAVMAGGYSEQEYTVGAPNIRIKRPLESADLIFRRHAGDVVFADGETPAMQAEREIARQLSRLMDSIDNSEEYLCSLAIQGTITYTTADQANFTVTYPKPAGNTITLSTFWDQANSTPLIDVLGAQRQMHTEVTLNPTHAVCGDEATDEFLQESEVRTLLDNRRIDAGSLELQRQIQMSGALYLGRFRGIEWWSYPSQVTVGGVATDLIRSKYVEFLHASPAAEYTMYYGAINDLDALEAGLLASRRFSKSRKLWDPSVFEILVTSRPLPVLRRPGAVVSMKVVSG
jgi:hypothetical protein